MTSMNHVFFQKFGSCLVVILLSRRRTDRAALRPYSNSSGWGFRSYGVGAVYLGTNWMTSESEYLIGDLQKTLSFKGK